jgi:DNA-binding NtrC family response regulator
VLLLGETGTGKSLAARAIHSNSICRDYPFTTFACGSVTGTLFESELFGHVKGAFTGAQSDRNGLWREAENGTLFFDEIGELPLDQQAKILVALDRNVVKPAGSDKEVKVNARLIFATNQDLDAMVQEGRFRDDLYWRIRYITIEMPPLRDQRDSIPFIAAKLWETICCDKKDVPLSKEIMDMLKEINWPGNVRNLKAVLKSLYWENVNKRPKDLQDLLGVLGAMQLSSSYIGGSCEPELEANEIDLHRVKCLRHLKKNEEWLRSCQKIFEPFFLKNTGQKSMELLDKRLLLNRSEQIKSLTNEPFLFYKEETFIRVHKLQGKLAYFSELIENKLWTEAALYLNQELKDDFNKAQSLLFKSVQALLR